MTQTLQEKIADIIVDYEKPESAAREILALMAAEREALAVRVETLKGWDRCITHAELALSSGTCTECAKRKECNEIAIAAAAVIRDTSTNL